MVYVLLKQAIGSAIESLQVEEGTAVPDMIRYAKTK
jgi:hypothetical protein